jgi:hypothetical protein
MRQRLIISHQHPLQFARWNRASQTRSPNIDNKLFIHRRGECFECRTKRISEYCLAKRDEDSASEELREDDESGSYRQLGGWNGGLDGCHWLLHD